MPEVANMSKVEAKVKPDARRGDNAPAWSPDPLARLTPTRGTRVMPVLVTLLVVAVAILLGGAMWDAYMGAPWTRDGTVRAYVVTMAPEVAGRIVELPIVENKNVHKGDLLMIIDPTNYTIAVNQAEAAVQQGEASVQNIDAQIAVQQAQISANQAQVDRAQAALVFAKQQAGRYGKLAQDGWGTVQDAQQYTSQLQQQTAASADNTGQPGSRAAANRVAECAAPERRGERHAGESPTPPGASESPAHTHSFPGRRLCDEPAGAARRLRQRWREHDLDCRCPFILDRRVFRRDQHRADPRG